MEEVGKILPFIFAKRLPREGSCLVAFLTALWPQAVGKGIAEHSRPTTFVSGTLTLATACPSWAAQLDQMSEELRAGINGFLGGAVVTKLRVRHAPSLSLETGKSTSKLGTGNRKLETRNWKLEKPALELTGLDPEIARCVEEAFVKYFSEAPNRQRRGREQGRSQLCSPRKLGI